MPRRAATPDPSDPPAPRRAGRPRHDGRTPEGDPTDEILTEAGRLFGEHGITGTTMASIATAAGLKQSSLYYYFRSRDDIVAALVERANVVPLELAESLAAHEGSPAARLHCFVRGDVEALCRLQLDIGETHRLATRERDRFADYWRGRRRLERILSALVVEGIAASELRDVDPKLTALLLMGNDEGVQNWYRAGSRRRPAEIGAALADLAVGGLLTPGTRLDRVTAESARIAADLG